MPGLVRRHSLCDMAMRGKKEAEDGLLAGLRDVISNIAGLATDLSQLRTGKEKGKDKDRDRD